MNITKEEEKLPGKQIRCSDGMRRRRVRERERVKRACTPTDKARMYHEIRRGIKHTIVFCRFFF